MKFVKSKTSFFFLFSIINKLLVHNYKELKCLKESIKGIKIFLMHREEELIRPRRT